MPMSSTAGPATIADVLLHRAATRPERVVFTYLEGDAPADRIGYGELARRARALASRLLRHAQAGDRALIVAHPGLDYVVAVYGAFIARLVAVPTTPVHGRRGGVFLHAVSDDCRPAVLVCDGRQARRLADGGNPILGAASRTPTVSAGPEALDDEAEWRGPSPKAHDLAVLQYTSGSTGQPKGVMLRHANLMDNLERQRRLFGVSAESAGVIWLPPYHDMGLGSGLLQPVYSDSEVVLMSPMHTMQKPLRWLKAISDHRASVSGGPPSAYAAAAASLAEDPSVELDLQSWTCAFVGAEPISTDVLERFASAVRPFGFRRGSLQPCYGLAEATLLVTGCGSGEGPRTRKEGDAGAGRVSCGRPVGGCRVRIVDPVTHAELPDGAEGEVWVQGAGVAAGYWERPAETRETFQAPGGGEAGDWLRTGDLGMLTDEELTITGRIKDVVVYAGRKIHAEDIEAGVRALPHPQLATAAMAAFGAVVDGREVLVVAIEMRRMGPEHRADLARIEAAVRAVTARDHDAAVHQVVFLPVGAMPRTSSGKVRRHLCRRDYLAERATVQELEPA